MAERIEYQGDALPSGLPGFGGGSISVLTLPGFNRIVAPQQFGPAVDAPSVTPPSPIPPPGNTPDNPAPGPVTPSPAPAPPSTGGGNFCKQCESQGNYGQLPLYAGTKLEDICTDCNGNRKKVTKYFTTVTSDPDSENGEGGQTGLFWDGSDGLEGKSQSNVFFKLTSNYIALTKDKEQYFCEPKKIKVCVDGEVHDWWVLAYDETEDQQGGG